MRDIQNVFTLLEHPLMINDIITKLNKCRKIRDMQRPSLMIFFTLTMVILDDNKRQATIELGNRYDQNITILGNQIACQDCNDRL